MKSRIKNKMRGGSPAYDHHVAEGFLNNEATILSNMGITQLESGPVENYANLYQISGGARQRSRGSHRRRRGSQRRRRSVQKSRRTSKRNTSSRQKRSNKRYGSRRRARSRSKRCGCGKKNK